MAVKIESRTFIKSEIPKPATGIDSIAKLCLLAFRSCASASPTARRNNLRYVFVNYYVTDCVIRVVSVVE